MHIATYLPPGKVRSTEMIVTCQYLHTYMSPSLCNIVGSVGASDINCINL